MQKAKNCQVHSGIWMNYVGGIWIQVAQNSYGLREAVKAPEKHAEELVKNHKNTKDIPVVRHGEKAEWAFRYTNRRKA